MGKGKISRLISVFLSAVMVLSIFAGNTLHSSAAGKEYADTDNYESLAEIYKDYFKVGAACEAISHWGISVKEIGNPAKEKAISTLFNSITCGNEMKPAYNFSTKNDKLFVIDKAADEMMKWATENGVAMRGHTLVWHGQINPSIFGKNLVVTSNGVATTKDDAVLDADCLVDRDTLLERLRTYIYSMMEYTYANGYAATIYAWDVVNEAMDEGRPDKLRASYWYKIIGPEFLYYSFLYAREAEVKYSKEYAYLYGLDAKKDDLSSIQPKLFYNDYNEWFPARVNAIIDYTTTHVFNAGQSMVKSSVINKNGDGTLKGDGLVDGIGMQGHLSDDQDIASYISALKKYSDAVGEVHITELDVGCTSTGDTKWYKQAEFYFDFFSALVEAVEDGANLTSVTLWGLTDDSSWRDTSYPLLLNGDLSMKPAYLAVAKAGKKEEFDITIADSISELTDSFYDFESTKVDGKTVVFVPEDNGFLARGAGHQPRINAAFKMNHTPGIEMGFGLKVTRSAKDANLRINISKYCGKNLTVTFYGKSSDSTMYMGLDGTEPLVLKEKNVNMDEWTKFMVNFDVPAGKSAFLFVETDGTADFYIDDVSIVFTKEGETPPEITEDDEAETVDGIGAPDEQTANKKVENNTEIEPSNEGSGLYINALMIPGAVVLLAVAVILAVRRYKKK